LLKEPVVDQNRALEVVSFNGRNRHAWIARMAASVPPGSRVLDIGAGPARYRPLFAHCQYKTQDFAQYKGQRTGVFADNWSYAEMDYVSDITAIPVDDASFDALVCTEVLEHVPEPIRALAEMARILRPGGSLFLTAPLGSALHQEPFHFYGGYTPHFYRKFLPDLGFDIVTIEPNGGLFLHTAQEIYRCAQLIDEDLLSKYPENERPAFIRLKRLMTGEVPIFLAQMEEARLIPEGTIGYHVHARKKD
jgi:SAM-dependent methyltransferase